jgi:adenylylsulfate kinase
MKSAPTIWITGLSQSGKTTLAHALADMLCAKGKTVEIVDGRYVRDEIGDFLGYSKEERMKVSRILCAIAKLLAKNGILVIVTSITPYQESRDFNRAELEPYFEIYLECSVDTCIARDKAQMYKKALRGDIKHFIGVDDPFEMPKTYDLKINTEHDAPAAMANKVQEALACLLST